ncbi:ESPR-type extended signal peptide-containing protein [Acinetobacter sp.]|uniref:ESPR-type extended signal peptide-containing protein n=1 Tax=Acinetobacter sp. TaxID=472 RepID=UPI00388D09D7
MNKVFKTVWNASLGVWVAVSETASSQKKGSNKLKKAAANAVATVAIGAATIGGVHAAGWSNGQGGTPGTGSIAIGTSEAAADASAEQSTAVGSGAQAGGGSVALGFGADSSAGQDSLALGLSATASSGSTIAIGANSAASGSSSLAIGTEATSIGTNGTAVGTQAKASAEGATALGKSAQAAGKNAIAIGNGTNSGYEESIAIGTKAVVSKVGAMVIGTGTASGQYATVIGGASSVSLAGAASGDSSVVIGTGKAKGKSSVVVGNGEASGQNASVIGAGTASGQNATVIGGGTASGQDSTVIGGGDASGISAQVFGGGTAIGERAKVFGAGTASGSGAQVFGAGEAKGVNAYVFGGGKAEGDETSVFGSGIATGLNALVVGGGTAAAANSMVMGTSTVSAANAVAIGANSNIGNAGSNSIVLGNNVSLNKANSVALGENSILRTINLNVKDATINLADIKGKDGAVVTAEEDRIYEMTFAGSAKDESVGAVSVGSQGKERQIQYVGAGRINASSTDAVNGSQLYAVLSQVASLEATPITFNDSKGGQATVNLGDTFNIEGATVKMVDGKPVLTVNAAEAAAWKLATGGDVTNASTIGGDTNVVDFVGGKNAEVSQTVLTDATGKPIGTQLTVEVADQIELTENGGLTIAGVPQGNGPITINQGNVNFGGNVISGVAPGVAGTDAVNVDQLKGSGWGLGNATVLDVDGNVVTDANNQPVTTAKINPDDQVEHKAGPSNNVTVNTTVQKVAMTDENGDVVVDANGQPVLIDKATVTVDLADQINLSKAGGLTVAGGDTYNLLDADGNELPTTYVAGDINLQQGNVSFGGNQIHDVAVGTALTDAVNVSQLKDALDTLGGGATVNPDGSINAPSYTVGAGNTTVNTVGAAIDVLNQGFKLTSSNASGAADETIQAGDKIDITVTKENNNLVAKQDGSTIEFALANQIALTGDTAGLTIGAGSNGNQPIVIQQGNVSFGGNVLQNVGAGVNATDAVNVSQLQSAGWNIITQNKDAAGQVTGTTENAVNGDKAENTSAVQFNGDNNISVSQNSVTSADGKTTTTIEVELEKDIDLSEEGSLTIGNTFLNDAGLTLAGATVGSKTYAPIIINQGNVNFGGNVIGGVAKGEADDDAVNVSQLKDEIGKAVSDSGWTLTTGGVDADQGEKIKPNTTVDFSGDQNITVSNDGSNVTVGLNPNVNLGADGSVTIGDTLLDGTGLTVGDITIKEGDVDFAGNQLNNVEAATEDHQAVNLGQLKDELGGLEETINNNIANSGWNLTGQDADGNAVTEKVNPDETVEFVAGPSGNTTVTTETTANGAKVTVDIKDQITLTGDAGSLTIGAGKGNNAITIEQGNVSVGGNQIHNLAAGTDGKDAVNVDQLKGTVNIFGGGAAVNPDGSIKAPTYNVNGGSHDNVGDALGALNQADIDLGDRVTNLQQSFNNRIDDVEDRMSAGIASAMALETAPYVPGKYTYAAATAYHNGQAALGITLRKTADNGRWSLTGGVATGTEGDPSVRLGVSGIID